MRKYLLAGAALAALVLGVPVVKAVESNSYAVLIVNNSTVPVWHVYATNRDNTTWGKDILDKVIEPGDSYIVDLNDGSGYCIYDLKAESQDKSISWTDPKVNVCEELIWTLSE